MNIIRRISKYNFNSSTISRLKDGYIVIHYTGDLGSAEQQCAYSSGGDRGKSAHLFVDFNGDVYQSVEIWNIAWHCGANSYKHPKCRNTNSIGIELCCRTTGDKTKADGNWYFEDATVKAAIELTKELMDKYNIPEDHVIRHYDVTGKICPAPFYYNNGKHTWQQFQAAIRQTSSSMSSSSQIQNQTNSLENVAKKGWDAFISAGYPEVVAAAFLGNLEAESGLKSNNLQNSYEKIIGMDDETYTAAVDNKVYAKMTFYNDKAGYGLAQWTYWSRKKAMYEYIIEKLKKSIGDADAQFEFLLHELNTSFSGLVTKLKACKTVKEASDLIVTQYEKPANQSDFVKNTRASYGQKFYEKFHQDNGSDSSYKVPFFAKVDISDLNIRKGPGTNYAKTGLYTGKGIFTIVEVVNGSGSTSGWGLLKAYQQKRDGWISLDFVTKQ